MAIAQRLHDLRRRLPEGEWDAILVSQPENYRYLTGFTGASGALLVSKQDAVLATDSIHFEQAKTEAPGIDVLRIRTVAEGLADLVGARGIEKLGFEASSLSFAQYRRLADEAGKLQVRLIPTEGVVESLRAVKEEDELSDLLRAARIVDDAMEHIAGEIRPGMTEKEAAWEIERFLRENGSEAVPFEIIVASGPNAALPHARPTDRAISPGEPVVFDLGARVNGYASDLSRSLCLDPAGETFTAIYELVLKAQLAAMENLEAGMTGEQADELARKVIREGGYGDAFGHGLGHGVGLAVHEEPRLGPNSKDVIREGMVFTIEPGVYVAGWGGVRIEDTVMMKNGRVRSLTRAGKQGRLSEV